MFYFGQYSKINNFHCKFLITVNDGTIWKIGLYSAFNKTIIENDYSCSSIRRKVIFCQTILLFIYLIIL